MAIRSGLATMQGEGAGKEIEGKMATLHPEKRQQKVASWTGALLGEDKIMLSGLYQQLGGSKLKCVEFLKTHIRLGGEGKSREGVQAGRKSLNPGKGGRRTNQRLQTALQKSEGSFRKQDGHTWSPLETVLDRY